MGVFGPWRGANRQLKRLLNSGQPPTKESFGGLEVGGGGPIWCGSRSRGGELGL